MKTKKKKQNLNSIIFIALCTVLPPRNGIEKILFNRKQFIKLKSIYHCQQYNDRYVCIIEVDNKKFFVYFFQHRILKGTRRPLM